MIALALAAMLLAAPPEAHPSDFKFDRACMDDYGRDLCDADVLKGIRDSFNAPPVESLAREGWAGVRVYLVDGYSHDLPMVTVARKGDGPVEVETRAWRPTGGPRVFRTGLGAWGIELADLYAGLVKASPERVAPPEAKAGNDLRICLHAWVTVTEVFDAKGVHRRIRNACDDDGLFDGGLELSRLAFGRLGDCAVLEEGQYRGHPQRIESCAQLGGDPVSFAVAVRNRMGDTFLRGPAYLPPGQFAEVFSVDATLERAGETLTGRDAAVAGWTAALSKAARFQILDVVATRKEVRVRARLLRDHELAPVEQTWFQDKDYRWRLRSSSIGPYGPAKAD